MSHSVAFRIFDFKIFFNHSEGSMDRVIPCQIIQGPTPWHLRFFWNLDQWKYSIKLSNPENLSLQFQTDPELSPFKYLPEIAFRAQNPPFLIYVFAHISTFIGAIALKICTGKFSGMRNSKMQVRSLINKYLLRYLGI